MNHDDFEFEPEPQDPEEDWKNWEPEKREEIQIRYDTLRHHPDNPRTPADEELISFEETRKQIQNYETHLGLPYNEDQLRQYLRELVTLAEFEDALDDILVYSADYQLALIIEEAETRQQEIKEQEFFSEDDYFRYHTLEALRTRLLALQDEYNILVHEPQQLAKIELSSLAPVEQVRTIVSLLPTGFQPDYTNSLETAVELTRYIQALEAKQAQLSTDDESVEAATVHIAIEQLNELLKRYPDYVDPN